LNINKQHIKYFTLTILFLFLALSLSWFFARKLQETVKVDDAFRKNAPGKFLEMPDGLTHYLTTGPDTGQTIIFVHGGSQVGLYVWSKNYNILNKEGYRTCMYDLYGRGFSDRPNRKHTLELFTEQLTTFSETICPEKKIILVALSMGAMPAIDFAAKHPEKVKKLILIDPAALNSPFKNPVINTPLINRLFITFYWHPRAVDKQMNEFHAPTLLPEYREQLDYFSSIEGLEETNLSTWLDILSGNVRNQLKELETKKMPTTLIYGEKDPYFSTDLAKEYIKIIPDISTYSIRNAGHVSNYENSKKVNEIMINELKSTSRK
jgi:pimeloyl-ACP methyl ester carboxylesterase